MNTEFNPNDFITIEHARTGVGYLPNSIRINQKSMSLGSGVVAQYKSEEYKTRLYATLAYSEKHQAIMLTKEGASPYTFVIQESTKTAILSNLPTKFRDLKIPKGLYLQSPENPNVFLYTSDNTDVSPSEQDRKLKYFIEDEDEVEVGDIVSWFCRPPRGSSRRNSFIATGVVASTFEKEIGGQYTKACAIDPISKNWFDHHQTTKKVYCNTDLVIIREKLNA